jgi:putative transposase
LARIIELAQVRRRFGYRCLHDLLRLECPTLSHKKIYRLYREADLAARCRKKLRKPPGKRQPLSPAAAPNAVWSMDFVSDALANRRRLKCLTIFDDCTRACIDITVDHGISCSCVVRVLERASRLHSYPYQVLTDNGLEFTSRTFIARAQWHGISHLRIEPGCPKQTGYIERFYGRFSDERLNKQWFESLSQVLGCIARWQQADNTVRPHNNLERIALARFTLKQRQRASGVQKQTSINLNSCISSSIVWQIEKSYKRNGLYGSTVCLTARPASVHTNIRPSAF